MPDEHFTPTALLARLEAALAAPPFRLTMSGGGCVEPLHIEPFAVLISRGDLDYAVQLLRADTPAVVGG